MYHWISFSIIMSPCHHQIRYPFSANIFWISCSELIHLHQSMNITSKNECITSAYLLLILHSITEWFLSSSHWPAITAVSSTCIAFLWGQPIAAPGGHFPNHCPGQSPFNWTCEIICLAITGTTVSATGLELYYKFAEICQGAFPKYPFDYFVPL